MVACNNQCNGQSLHGHAAKNWTFAKALQVFSDGTTFHGCKVACGSQISIGRRVFWVSFVIASITLCIMKSYEAVEQYLRYDTVDSISIKRETYQDFPAITLCSINQLQNSTIASYGEEARDAVEQYVRTLYHREWATFTLEQVQSYSKTFSAL